MKNVLILGGGTQGLITVKLLHECGYRVVAVCGEKNNYIDASRYIDSLHYCIGYKGERYFEFVKQVMIEEHIDAVVPMGDITTEFLCEYRDQLPSSVKIKLPTYENFLKGYDKNQLMTLCMEKGYPHPQTIDLCKVEKVPDGFRRFQNGSEGEDLTETLKNFHYPAMLKPNCTTGGRGMVEVKSYDELKERYPDLHKQYGEYHLQRFIMAGGRQVKIQLYVDEQKQLLAHSVQQKLRWYPNKGGSNTCAVSIEDAKMVDICYQILKGIDWVGFADFDAIEDPDTKELLIMEINPRLPACIKGSVVAGINWSEIIVNDYLGLPQKNYEYKTGVYLRHLGLDFLWFLHAENRWSVKPNWFKLVGKNIYYQDASSWSDPMPFLMGTWHNIAKLFDPEFKKAKKG